jgi:hypothetical protein
MDETEKALTQRPAGPQPEGADPRSEGVGNETLPDLREQKAAEYMRAALAVGDPLVANVSVLNADLMYYAMEIRRMLESGLKAAAADVDELGNLFPAIDGALRVHRQSERFSVLIHRLTREQAAAQKVVAQAAKKEADSAAAGA